MRETKWGSLMLFVSIPTLLCCALPILLVGLGMGPVVASLYGEHLPFLQWFGHNQHITFSATALILTIAGWVLYYPSRTCPADSKLAMICNTTRIWNVRFYWSAIVIWCIGFSTAFIFPIFISL